MKPFLMMMSMCWGNIFHDVIIIIIIIIITRQIFSIIPPVLLR